MGKLVTDRQELIRLVRLHQAPVFTNGCFDILHVGHVRYLQASRALGDCLVVGVNSDASVRRLGKGADRPINSQQDRAEILAALGCVDYVMIFDQDTPLDLIIDIQPKILTKGGDWQPERIVGSAEVLKRGGQVVSIPFVDGKSTTSIIGKVRNSGESFEPKN